MQVDFKKEGAGGKNARNSQDIRESELLCVTDFDFIYDCPMSKLIMYFGYLSLFGILFFSAVDSSKDNDPPKSMTFSK